MKIYWNRLEEAVYEQLVQDLKRFAKKHQDKAIYAYGVECNTGYEPTWNAGLNSEAGLKKMAILRKRQGMTSNEETMRWSQGDWLYSDIVNDIGARKCKSWRTESQGYLKEWRRLCDVIENMKEPANGRTKPEREQQQMGEEFTRRLCRAVMRMWLDDVFDILNKTDDFSIVVSNHDDTAKQCRDRFKKNWTDLASKKQKSPHVLPSRFAYM